MSTGRSKIIQPGPGAAFVPKQRRASLFAVCAALALATNFSACITGVLIPPQTGAYKFWVASAGASELWLSSDGSPADKIKIAAVTSRMPYRKWPHINEAESQSVTLTAGRRYDFELRQWQGGGSTQLHVRWQLPDGSEERPIPAFRFALPK